MCFLFASLNYIVDPFQYFRKSSLLNNEYHKNQRFQVPGMIKNINSSNFVIGTSMGENFETQRIDKELNWNNTLRLSVSGIMPSSQKILLNFLNRSRKVNNIIMDLHWYLAELDPNKKNSTYDFPQYLYSDSLWGKIKYLINSGVLKESTNLLLKHKSDFKVRNKLNNWMNDKVFANYTKDNNLILLSKKLTSQNNKITVKSQTFQYPSFEKNLFPFLQNNPNITFYLFLPPYSTWHYKTIKDQDFLLRLVFFRSYLTQKLQGLKNVKLFAVDENFSIVNNLANYKDYGHFRNSVNKYIIHSIKNSKHQIDSSNIKVHMEKFIQNINAYEKVLISKPYIYP